MAFGSTRRWWLLVVPGDGGLFLVCQTRILYARLTFSLLVVPGDGGLFLVCQTRILYARLTFGLVVPKRANARRINELNLDCKTIRQKYVSNLYTIMRFR